MPKGVPLSQEHKDNIRKSMKNKPKSSLHKLNIKKSMLNKNLVKSDQSKAEYQKQRRDKIKIDLILLHGGKCKLCGIEYNGKNLPIFDLHHLDRNSKTKSSRNNNGCRKERILQEKCILVCANCHRMIHTTTTTTT